MSCSRNDTLWDRPVHIPAGEIAALPGRRFAAWPRHIRQVFEPARTVQAGAQSFRLTTDPAGDA